MMLMGSWLAPYFNTPAAIILFFFLVLFVNTGLGLLQRSWMLQRGELAVVYIMWIVATSIPSWGFTMNLIPQLAGAFYYATPENNWHNTLLPFIPDWIVPKPEPDAVKFFFEGAPSGYGVPWDLWLPPLLYWLPFTLALYVVMIATMVILRKQWVQHERLVFPLVQLPISMVQDENGSSSLIKPFFKSWLLWLGFAIPFIQQTLNGLNHHFPEVPTMRMGYNLPLFGGVNLPIRLSFQMVGFSYLINRDIAFGLCFFFLLNTALQGLLNFFGFQKVDPLLGAYSSYTGSIIVYHGFGGVVVLVLFGLWTARGHLRQVAAKAFGGAPQVDDSDEILSYRAACLSLLGGLLLMGVWLWHSGLPAWTIPFYLALVLVLFVALTRVVAEGGLAHIFAPMTASAFMVGCFGTRAFGTSGIVTISFTYVWASDIMTFVMASCANGLKLAEETIRRNRRGIFWAMIIAILLALVSSSWMVLDLGYQHGGINTGWFFFDTAILRAFDNAALRLQADTGWQWENWGHTGTGAAIMGLLMIARQRFLWWPFHPLGFPISMVFGTMFFSVFLAWVFKTIVLKYGGPSLYLRTRPLFLGLILGQFVTAGLWYLADFITGTRGNPVMSW